MKTKTSKRRKTASRPDPNPYPKGWDRQRVESLAAYYDRQSDDEAIAEMDAAFNDGGSEMIHVPLELVPRVQKLLAKRAG